jgi:hypothetical protein
MRQTIERAIVFASCNASSLFALAIAKTRLANHCHPQRRFPVRLMIVSGRTDQLHKDGQLHEDGRS